MTLGAKEKRITLDRVLNFIAAEMVAQPRHKYMFLKGMRDTTLGKRVVISPGTRLESSVIGNDVNIGLGAVVKDSYIGDGCYITANAVVKNTRMGRGSIVGANVLLEDTEVPPKVIVTGRGRFMSIEEARKRRTHRNVRIHYYDRNPMWGWWVAGRDEGFLTIPSAVPKYAIINHIPRWLQSSAVKVALSGAFCRIDDGVYIHYTVILDPIFTSDITIGEGTRIERDSIVLTHSFLGLGDYRLEHGITTLGRGVRIGEHCVVVPGVSVPDDVRVPDYSVATANGMYLVKEDTYVRYDEA